MPYICLMPLGISISWHWWKRISYLSWYFEVIIPSCYNTNWYGFSGNPTNSDNLIFASTWSQKQEYCYKSTVLRFTAAAKSLQSCLTLCYPTDGSPPGSSVPGILQARTLEWVAISFSSYYARVAHRAAKTSHLLDHQFIIKGYNSGAARWPRTETRCRKRVGSSGTNPSGPLGGYPPTGSLSTFFWAFLRAASYMGVIDWTIDC